MIKFTSFGYSTEQSIDISGTNTDGRKTYSGNVGELLMGSNEDTTSVSALRDQSRGNSYTNIDGRWRLAGNAGNN